MTPDMAFKRGRPGKSDLPEGKTCGDCANSERCFKLFSRIPEDEVCDWSPSMFRDKAELPTQQPVLSDRCAMGRVW